ncbi:MAG TPA: LAGLIDADG family homing endonuclease [Acidimicrobiales bacterium]|nr:LAGLIDADG family homing endonuclease [Acidimicrobiales bacterium]
MAIAPQRAEIGIRRHFTTPGVHPYDEVRWERRDARMTNYRDGTVAFEQLGVEVPESWSVNATNILAQKYFRGTLNTPEREWSLRQVADRVVDTITEWGIRDGYFVDAEEAQIFNHELKHLIIHQKAAFNSPVWFNIGVAGVPQQGSACFILSVEDTMDSILNWYTEEGIIFKGGSGAGVNLSRIRSSHEMLKGGGTASGPVSFMRGADASAGTIKSGGKTRRAAKMVILDVDHPDVEDFIWCKAIEERKARVLRDAGFDMDLDGVDSHSTQYQNANNSVRVTDEFMEAVLEGRQWDLVARTDGSVVRTVSARDLFRQIAHSAWECADPGMQFDTTINRWHTAPNTGRISGSNPCFPGSARVHTDKGLIRFAELLRRANEGETFGIYTHDATNPDAPAEEMLITSPEAFMITGYNDIVRLRFDNGTELRCTPSHRIFTTNRGYVEARQLVHADDVKLLDLEAPAVNADWGIPVSSDPADYRTEGDDALPLRLPAMWSEELAHYMGWLIGDGSTSGTTVATSYGSAEGRDEALPRHAELLDRVNCERPLKPSEHANGTVQLRLAQRPFARFMEALGVRAVAGPAKGVPWSVEQAPAEVVAAFLRGLFDADGWVVTGGTDHSVGLGSASAELLRGVQRLLSTFGIISRIGKGSGRTHYGSSSTHDLRITGESMVRFARHIGFSLSPQAALLRQAIVDAPEGGDRSPITARLLERTDDGAELTYNLSEPRNHSYVVDGVVVRNCSEYMHLDNSACNLASMNLLKFLGADGVFDVEGFKAAVGVVFTGQEIIVGNADYPTEKIAVNTRAFRQLGIGYANLGALLMAQGLPYDSEAGRAWAAAITALLTGHAYATSARTAARMGPFAGYHQNTEPMLGVLRMHQAEAARIDEEVVPPEVLSAAQEAWDQAVELAEQFGVRNSQASVLAPTGTIGLLMDCDTTGVEPDLGLVKTKKLVGGGTMSIVNQTVPRALARLGYGPAQVEDIINYVNEHMSIVGAPHLAPEHLPVFACSMGDNTIHYLGHIKMMGAVQPFISGAISKTVNMPEDVTVEDVEQMHIDSWRLGLKAVAIYRDNCKVAQPLSTTKKESARLEGGDGAPAGSAAEAKDRAIAERIAELEAALVHERQRASEPVVVGAVRERLPRRRNSKTFHFRVADCEGYVTVGEYEDGRPGEVFINVSKQGSTLAGIMDAFSISLSLGLQHQVPLATYVRKYTNMKFEPAGITDDSDLRIATSLVDYIFRRIALDYLPLEERTELGILSTTERMQPTLPGVEEMATPNVSGVSDGLTSASTAPAPSPSTPPSAPPSVHPEFQPLARAEQRDAPFCYSCGNVMQRAGSCYVCGSCGATSGCS